MKAETEPTAVGKLYNQAHNAHYKDKNLQVAVEGYLGVIAAYPKTLEATYSQTQIQNIAKLAVPSQALVEALANMALLRLQQNRPAEDSEHVAAPSQSSHTQQLSPSSEQKE